MYSPISCGSASFTLSSAHSVSCGSLQSSWARLIRYSAERSAVIGLLRKAEVYTLGRFFLPVENLGCAWHSVLGRPVRLHLAAPLEPAGEQPADERPDAAQSPAGQHVGRPVDPEVDATAADEQGDQHGEPEQERLEPPPALDARQQGAEGEIGGRRHRRVAA